MYTVHNDVRRLYVMHIIIISVQQYSTIKYNVHVFGVQSRYKCVYNNNIIKTAVLGAAADAICVCLIYLSTILLYYYLLLLLCM